MNFGFDTAFDLWQSAIPRNTSLTAVGTRLSGVHLSATSGHVERPQRPPHRTAGDPGKTRKCAPRQHCRGPQTKLARVCKWLQLSRGVVFGSARRLSDFSLGIYHRVLTVPSTRRRWKQLWRFLDSHQTSGKAWQLGLVKNQSVSDEIT